MSSSPAPPPNPEPEVKALDLDRGVKLGKYEIIKKLAAGGMAEIFLARASGLSGFEKMVVVKRILPQLAAKKDFVDMFLDEARIACTLQHPNVVQVYDVGAVDENYFIAMEYLHGEDLVSMLQALIRGSRRMPLEHALHIMNCVCSGLHYAHEKVGFDGKPLNIVHRDVTPHNVIVTYDGGVKLLDFGIAKASNRYGETRMGTLKGKVPYMSPEQCRAEVLDRRTDVFALGIMLYEITLGRRLYKGRSDFEILKQIVEGNVVAPRELDAEYPPALEAIVMKALEKDRDKRFQTARELQVALEALSRAMGLYLSSLSLAQFMEQLFGQKIEAWRDAQSQGKSLGQHLEQVVIVADDDEFAGDTPPTPSPTVRFEGERLPTVSLEAPRLVTPPAVGADRSEPVHAETDQIPKVRSAPRWRSVFIVVALALAAIGAWSLLRLRQRSEPSPAPILSPPVTSAPTVVPPTSAPPVAATPSRPADPVVPAAAPSTSTPHHHPPARKLDGEGTLLIGTEPWCNVRIDGVDRGPTPVSVKLPAGKHTAVLTNPEFKISRTISVTVQAGTIVRKKLDFRQ